MRETIAVLIGVLICISGIATVIASEQVSYDDMEKLVIETLGDTMIGAVNTNVHISDTGMRVTFMQYDTSNNALANNIGAIVGTYGVVVNHYPVMGDLTVNIRAIDGSLAGTCMCKSEWVRNVDLSNDYNLMTVIQKVFETIKVVN